MGFVFSFLTELVIPIKYLSASLEYTEQSVSIFLCLFCLLLSIMFIISLIMSLIMSIISYIVWEYMALQTQLLYFPTLLKKAISTWKYPSAINTLSYFGVSSCWICITIFAIGKSHIAAVLVFCASAAISKDLRLVSATTEWFAGDWFIWGRYPIFCAL